MVQSSERLMVQNGETIQICSLANWPELSDYVRKSDFYETVQINTSLDKERFTVLIPICLKMLLTYSHLWSHGLLRMHSYQSSSVRFQFDGTKYPETFPSP